LKNGGRTSKVNSQSREEELRNCSYDWN